IGAGGHRRDDLPRTHHAARRYRAGCGLMEGAPTAAELFAALRVLVAIDDERGLFDREAPEGGYRSETLERGPDVLRSASAAYDLNRHEVVHGTREALGG